MLHFHCLRSSLWLAHIFRHSGRQEIWYVWLYTKTKGRSKNNCNETIAKKQFQSDAVCFCLQIFPIRISWEFYGLVSLFLKYPSNRYYNNCSFVDLCGKYCPRSSHQPCKLGWYSDHGHYFPKQTKSKYIVLILSCYKD